MKLFLTCKVKTSSRGLLKEFDLYMPGQNFHWLAKKTWKFGFHVCKTYLRVGSLCDFRVSFFLKRGNEWFLFAKKFEWTLNFQCEAFNFSQFSEKKILCHNFMISQCSRVFAEKFLTLLNYNFQKRETFKSQIDITSCATFCLRHKTKQTLYFAWCDVVFLM